MLRVNCASCPVGATRTMTPMHPTRIPTSVGACGLSPPSAASIPIIQNGEVTSRSAARPLGTVCSAKTSDPVPPPRTMTPYNAVSQSSRPCGNRARLMFAATSRMAPEIRNRTLRITSGGSDSRAMRMARYVVPQKNQTATSARYARTSFRWGKLQRNIRIFAALRTTLRYTIPLIVTLTINPAIDHNVTADRLVFEDRAYILATSDSAGGRGINASRVIHSFGGKTLAIVTSGGTSGTRFEELLKSSGFPTEVVRIQRELRTNLTISDKHG